MKKMAAEREPRVTMRRPGSLPRAEAPLHAAEAGAVCYSLQKSKRELSAAILCRIDYRSQFEK